MFQKMLQGGGGSQGDGIGMKSIFVPNDSGSYITGGDRTFELDFEPQEYVFVLDGYQPSVAVKSINSDFSISSTTFCRIKSLSGTNLVVYTAYIRAGGNDIVIFYK